MEPKAQAAALLGIQNSFAKSVLPAFKSIELITTQLERERRKRNFIFGVQADAVRSMLDAWARPQAEILKSFAVIATVAEDYNRLAERLVRSSGPLFETVIKAAEIAGKEFRDARPPNWEGVEFNLYDRVVDEVLLSDGIPLAAVPPAKTVTDILSAKSGAERRVIIANRWRSITAQCDQVLSSLQSSHCRNHASFVREAINSFRDHHSAPAQALTANVIETLVMNHFSEEKRAIARAYRTNELVTGDQYSVRYWIVVAPLVSAYQQFHQKNGDPVPRAFARHASAHAVSRQQYSRVNTVVAIMLATSLLWYLDAKG